VQIYSEDTLSRGIPVAWTLCVEATFYVALPLWTLALDRARLGSGPRAWIRAELAALTAVAVAGAAVQVAASRLEVSHLVGTSLLGQCIWMAIGMALAVASVAGERSRAARLVTARPGFCWLGAAAAVTGLTILHRDVHGIVGIIQALGTPQPFAKTLTGIALSTVAITLVMLPAVFGERAGGVPRRLLALRPLVWLGVVSYGLYLWHLTIAELLALPAAPQHFSASGLNLGTEIVVGATPVLIVLTLAASGVLAGLSYRWVELPFLRRKER
jgi:peptidoglycan/LPS O-acetylase OafA/YrhL